MADNEEMARKWREKRYTGTSTYTLMKQPPVIQDIMVQALRTSTIVRLRRLTAGREFRRALDLGCGPGEWTVEYLGFAATVVGIDVNASFLEIAAKRGEMCGAGNRLTLEQKSLSEIDDFAGYDLVCFGACLMYVDDEELHRLFSRLEKTLAADGFVYLRATVVKPLRKAYETPGGRYRTRAAYESCFEEHGFEIADAVTSVDLVLKEVFGSAAQSRVGSLALAPLGGAVRGVVGLSRFFGGRNDYMNWILRRTA